MSGIFGKKKTNEHKPRTPPPLAHKKNGTKHDALSNLSPTSYAKQFDDLDNIVASHMEGLSLDNNGSNDEILDFDEDDAVYEDDNSDDEEELRKHTPDDVSQQSDRSKNHVRDKHRVLEDESQAQSERSVSSSSSMGAYDNASVGTTESEEDDEEGGIHKSGHGSDSAEDYTDDEDEGEDGYKVGGYHPVKVGEVYNQR
jgi:hypothetical protein